MATIEPVGLPPFDWGESVLIMDETLAASSGCSVASVCGVRMLEQESTAKEFGVRRESWLVLIELPDGTSLEVPAHKLGKNDSVKELVRPGWPVRK